MSKPVTRPQSVNSSWPGACSAASNVLNRCWKIVSAKCPPFCSGPNANRTRRNVRHAQRYVPITYPAFWLVTLKAPCTIVTDTTRRLVFPWSVFNEKLFDIFVLPHAGWELGSHVDQVFLWKNNIMGISNLIPRFPVKYNYSSMPHSNGCLCRLALKLGHGRLLTSHYSHIFMWG